MGVAKFVLLLLAVAFIATFANAEEPENLKTSETLGYGYYAGGYPSYYYGYRGYGYSPYYQYGYRYGGYHPYGYHGYYG